MVAGFRAELKSQTGKIKAAEGCLIVGEVAQAHDGSLGLAHAFVDAIADAGADAVKFQTHIAAAESTPSEPWRVKFSRQDASRYDYWKRMEFTEEQWAGLRVHAEDRGLFFLSSPFSIAAVELLERVGVAAWKIASGEISDTVMLDRILGARLPVMLSTGMSLISEIDDAVRRIREVGVPLAILQCTTEYPCAPERVGLNMISSYRDRFGCAVGLSDHSGTIYPGLAAVTLGAEVVEVHVTLSREMFGPDVASSITTVELRQLTEGIRFIEKMNAHVVNKDGVSRELGPLRKLFSKSIVARARIPAGTLLTEGHLALKKPGTGLPPARLSSLVGRRTLRTLEQDELVADDDVESKGAK